MARTGQQRENESRAEVGEALPLGARGLGVLWPSLREDLLCGWRKGTKAWRGASPGAPLRVLSEC